MTKTPHRRHAAVILAAALALTGCATAPPAQPLDLEVTLPETWAASQTPAGEVSSDWWREFGDPGLTDAVDTALRQNHDLLAAAARLEQAAAGALIAGAPLRPTLDAGLTGGRRRQNFIGFPIPGGEQRVLSSFSTTWGVSLNTTWEADLWGRLRAGARAAVAETQRSAAELRSARQSIAGQTVKAWFAVAEAHQQFALVEQTVASFTATADQVRGRFEQGLRPALDLRLSLSNLASAEANRSARLQQLDATTRQLEVLLGEYADRHIRVAQTLPEAPGPVPAGLPADLVSRRPDLVAAERFLAADRERLEVARRDLYPRFSLTASGGTSTRELTDLLNGDFGVWSLVGNLTQPLFDGGRLRAVVAQTKAQTDESLAAYAGAALTAFAEVETALAAESLLGDQERHLAEAVAQSRAAERLAGERYTSGLNDYISVLESQRQAFNAEASLIGARRLRLDNRVDLHLALGGGFEDELEPAQEDGTGPTSPQALRATETDTSSPTSPSEVNVGVGTKVSQR